MLVGLSGFAGRLLLLLTSVMIGLISLIILSTSETLNCERLGNPAGSEGNGKGSCAYTWVCDIRGEIKMLRITMKAQIDNDKKRFIF